MTLLSVLMTYPHNLIAVASLLALTSLLVLSNALYLSIKKLREFENNDSIDCQHLRSHAACLSAGLLVVILHLPMFIALFHELLTSPTLLSKIWYGWYMFMLVVVTCIAGHMDIEMRSGVIFTNNKRVGTHSCC